MRLIHIFISGRCSDAFITPFFHSGEREETIVARIALPSPSKGPGRYAEVVSVPTQHSRQPGPSNTGVVPAPIPPLPQPVARPPPVSSHGGGMSSLLERIMARLADVSSYMSLIYLVLIPL